MRMNHSNLTNKNLWQMNHEHPYNYGKRLPEAQRRKMSNIRILRGLSKGKNNPMYGKKGKDSPAWKGGISSLQKMIRALPEYSQWRRQIFIRDNWTCQNCGQRCSGCLVAHHDIKSFTELLAEFLQEYNQFSPYDDKDTLVRLAMKYRPFWELDNGITQCEKCHKLTEDFGIKNYNKKKEKK